MQKAVWPVRQGGAILLRLLLRSRHTIVHSLLHQHLRDVAARICQRIVRRHGVGDEKRLRRCEALRVRISELLGKVRTERAHAIREVRVCRKTCSAKGAQYESQGQARSASPLVHESNKTSPEGA